MVTNAPALNVAEVRERLKALRGGRFRAWLSICAHCGLCAESCFFYLAHDRDPAYMPAYKVRQTLGRLYKTKGNLTREDLEAMEAVAYGQCTLCRRCAMHCPFGIDPAAMIAAARAVMTSRDVLPDALRQIVANYQATGNQMAIDEEEFAETCEWMAEEAADEMPGLTIPIEQKGADMLYLINAREAKFYPQDIAEAAMIFHAAGQSFTFARGAWEATNLAMFAGDTRTAAALAKRAYAAARRLKVNKIGMTECGHAYRAMRYEGPYWLGLPHGEPPVPVIHSVQLFAEYIRSGRLVIDPAKKITEPVTYQDPCNISRNGGLWEDARFLLDALFTDFRDMQPNREYNHCCGGGGGFVPMGGPYKRRRMESGRVKAEQIRATGAQIVVTPCHNCFDQIKDLNVEYDLGVRVIHFKTVLPSMLVLPDSMKPKPEEANGGESETDQ